MIFNNNTMDDHDFFLLSVGSSNESEVDDGKYDKSGNTQGYGLSYTVAVTHAN